MNDFEGKYKLISLFCLNLLDIRRKIWRRSLRVLMIFGNNFSIGRY